MKQITEIKRELTEWIQDGCPSFKLGKVYSVFELQRGKEDGTDGYGVAVKYFDNNQPKRLPEKFFELSIVENEDSTELIDKYFSSIEAEVICI